MGDASNETDREESPLDRVATSEGREGPDSAERILIDLLRLGEFYLSAIEIDTHDRALAPLYSGEEFEERIQAVLGETGGPSERPAKVAKRNWFRSAPAALIEALAEKWIAVGKASAVKGIAKGLRERAGQRFIDGKDDAAYELRTYVEDVEPMIREFRRRQEKAEEKIKEFTGGDDPPRSF